MQSHHSPAQTIVLDSQKAIEVLLDSRQRKALLPFVGEATTVSRAARLTGESANTMLYRVRRWQRLGLLHKVGSTPHAKGAINLYTSCASTFFVPFAATSSEDVLAFGQSMYIPMLVSFLSQYAKVGEHLPPTWGFRFERGKDQWQMRPVKAAFDSCAATDEGFPAALLEIEKLRLSAEHAKALQRELHLLLHKYPNQADGQEYQIVVGMA